MTWLSGATTKRYQDGTVRCRSPEETFAAVKPYWSEMGMTRIANVTGLDRVGIPTALSIRPNARSLSVSQGKGLSIAAAKVSAMMESLELFHAEEPQLDLRLSTLFDMARRPDTIALDRLPRAFRAPYPALRTLWARGTDLLSGRTLWLPLGLVAMDMTLPLLEGSEVYPPTSNGLASGNAPSEALLHALCELIERDAYTRFFQQSDATRHGLRVNLATVRDPMCAALLSRFLAADLLVEVWEVTSDIGIPAYLCAVLERDVDSFRTVGLAYGSGAHLHPGIALVRALTEAAQTRLTRISGSRDDMRPEAVQQLQRASMRDRQLQQFDPAPGVRVHRADPVFDGATFEEDVRFVLRRLTDRGLTQVVAVDLSRPGWPVSVVRAVVPGLEGLLDAPSYRPGVRSMGAAKEAP